MDLTSTIINTVNDTLMYLKELEDIHQRYRYETMPKDLYIESFLTLRLGCPRGSGHTTASARLLKQHNGIFISCVSETHTERLIRSMGIPSEKIFCFGNLSRPTGVSPSLEPLDIVIFDPVSTFLNRHTLPKLRELKVKLSYNNKVKLFVELG